MVKWADHWNYAAFDLEGFVAKRDALHGQCDAAGRDPSEIMTSIHQPVDEGDWAGLEAQAERFKEAGLDLMLFYLPPPHTARVLEPLARLAERVG